jgi:hypothetical protein
MRAPSAFLIAILVTPSAWAADRWAVPAPGTCAPAGGRMSTERGEDTGAFPFQEGDVVGAGGVARLRGFLPAFVWAERDRFFHEGARLEVGPCFRDYSAPAFYREASLAPATIGENGALERYGVGPPFAPSGIASDAPTAGLAWLWNVEQRYQGAGFHGRFRLTNVTDGEAEPFEGEIFKVALAHRADLPGPDHAVEGSSGEKWQWVAGGEFAAPFDAKGYAWRQYRGDDSFRDAGRTDELHAYLPQWRRVRRLSASNVEGLFVPTPAIASAQSNQIAVGAGPASAGGALGAGGAGGGGGVGGSSGSGVGNPADIGSMSEPLRGGFEAFGLRPNLYDVRVIGLHDVLAPINTARPMWPAAKDRDFGPSGLSLAGDRWELRRAIVLDARRRGDATPTGRFRLYADLQTLQPLYLATYDAADELLDVAIFASRWSEDRPDYPRWTDDAKRPVRVLDPVATVVAGVGRPGGWRRESWDMVSTPPAEAELRRMISMSELTRGQ